MLLHTIFYVIALPVTHAHQGKPFPSAKTVFGSYQSYTDWDAGVAVPFTWFCAAWVNSIWTAPAYVVEETHNARISAPKAMVTSYLTTCIMGLVLVVITAFCISDMDALAADPTYVPLRPPVAKNGSKNPKNAEAGHHANEWKQGLLLLYPPP
jgi:amino acid transporter